MRKRSLQDWVGEKKQNNETMSQWQKRQVSKFLFFILFHSKVEILFMLHSQCLEKCCPVRASQ